VTAVPAGVLTNGMDSSRDFGNGVDAGESESEIQRLATEEAHNLDRARQSDKTTKILSDADRRDEEATARDAVSDERARVADRDAFMRTDGTYPGQGERRAAALDRANAKSDRESSAEDRADLADGGPVDGRAAATDGPPGTS